LAPLDWPDQTMQEVGDGKATLAWRPEGLAAVVPVMGVVERFGYGLIQARRALKANGNPPLTAQFEPNYTLFKVEPVR
jgi:predicted HTH transcriptional regulator